jgi:hypothetical protein
MSGKDHLAYSEVILAFAPNNACPYLGVFFINEKRTREKREENERRTGEDFSQNDLFKAFLTPIYRRPFARTRSFRELPVYARQSSNRVEAVSKQSCSCSDPVIV